MLSSTCTAATAGVSSMSWSCSACSTAGSSTSRSLSPVKTASQPGTTDWHANCFMRPRSAWAGVGVSAWACTGTSVELGLPGRHEQGLHGRSDGPLQVVHRAAGEPYAGGIHGRAGVQAHPLATGRALQVEGEVGVDEHVARPVEGGAGAVAEI